MDVNTKPKKSPVNINRREYGANTEKLSVFTHSSLTSNLLRV